MVSIAAIQEPIKHDFELFNQHYREEFSSDNPILTVAYQHILASRGKQLRPTLLLLAAKLCGEVTERSIYSAVVLEMLHMVSLVHDDVVDNTLERRGRSSLNGSLGNPVAVLTGDYLLSRCMQLCFDKIGGEGEIQRVLSRLVGKLASGELWQMFYAEHAMWEREHYLNIVSKKTAALFASCTEIGALSVGASSDVVRLMANVGEWLGICFQIRDDVFDYSPHLQVGKPALHDVREGKITLPLILTLQHATAAERERLTTMVKEQDFSPEQMDWILHLVHKYDGIALASAEANRYQQMAREALLQFPESPVREALLGLVDFVGRRTL